MTQKRQAQAALRGEDFTALSATTVEDLTTRFGFHARTETVVALTADNGRLKCTFHSELFSWKRNAAETIADCRAAAPQKRYETAKKPSIIAFGR